MGGSTPCRKELGTQGVVLGTEPRPQAGLAGGLGSWGSLKKPGWSVSLFQGVSKVVLEVYVVQEALVTRSDVPATQDGGHN